MVDFEYIEAGKLADLTLLLGQKRGEAVILAGGTDLLDRLKERIVQPQRVVNIKALAELQGIRNGKNLQIGALTTIAQIARDENVARKYPVVAQAAASIATPQLRNMGTLGGNLCQRPRCWYFRGRHYHCLKKGGEMCYAVDGLNKYHAIFGEGPCHIVFPSDMAPALIASGADVEIYGPGGTKTLALEKFYRMPDEDPERENVLAANEVITKITIPAPAPGTRSTYLKFKEKESHDFAMSSVAAVVQVQAGRVRQARIVLGGVAPVPWRAQQAEADLTGKVFDAAHIQAAANAAVAGANPLAQNRYKIALTRNLVRRALNQLQA